MNRLLAMLLAVLGAGCSSSYLVSSSTGGHSIPEFNRVADRRQGSIVLELDSAEIWAVDIRATADSLFWNDEWGVRMSAALPQVGEVTFSDATRGTWEGIGLGALAGASAAGLVTLMVAGGSGDFIGIVYLITVPSGALVGGVVGSLAGNARGHTHRYRFR